MECVAVGIAATGTVALAVLCSGIISRTLLLFSPSSLVVKYLVVFVALFLNLTGDAVAAATFTDDEEGRDNRSCDDNLDELLVNDDGRGASNKVHLLRR